MNRKRKRRERVKIITRGLFTEIANQRRVVTRKEGGPLPTKGKGGSMRPLFLKVYRYNGELMKKGNVY